LLLTVEVQQVSCIANTIRCMSCYIANNNWRKSVVLLPRPDVVQVTLLLTTDVQQSVLPTQAEKTLQTLDPCSTSRKALPHKALSQYSE